MRKLSLFTAALLAGGLLFSGCIFLDHPIPQISKPNKLGCGDACGEIDPGSAGIDWANGTSGPSYLVYPEERGTYYFNVMEMEAAPLFCPLWETGGGSVRVDTFRNEADHFASGCPISYYCYWYGPITGYSLCEPDMSVPQPSFCNIGNGQCTGPFPGFWGSYTNSPPDTFFSDIYYIAIDMTPYAPVEGFNNVRRSPGGPCLDCGAGGSALQAPPGKTVVCHVPPGNPANRHTIVVGDAAVPAHLAHGDSLGECTAGPGGGEGLEVPAGNNAPFAQQGWYSSADFAPYLLTTGLAWTDDYFSDYGGTISPRQTALLDVLATLPVNEDGMVTAAISRLNGVESVTLDPAFEMTFQVDVHADGRVGARGMIADTQASLPQVIQFVIANTTDGAPLNLSGISIELSDGTSIAGSTLMGAMPQDMGFIIGHDRLYQALNDLQNRDSRDITPRVALR